MKCLLMGAGGREAVIADKLAEKFELYAVISHENPSIVETVEKTGGKYIVDKKFNKETIKEFIKENDIEYCVVNSDNLLQDGMIDLARECGLKTFGPTAKGARIEWDKEYALSVVEKVAPESLVKSFIVSNEEEFKAVKERYNDENFVVKPNGLTAGKGVKVGGVHFKTLEEGLEYAEECLKNDGVVIVQDKIVGHEFSIMGFTDGDNIVFAPTTYDYPYRYDDDKGPGTGGMGCVSYKNSLLPFLNEEDLEKCYSIMKKALKEINKDSKEFNGVLYGAFFKTEKDILFIEFNSRLGDPEALNVLTVMESSFADVAKLIADGESLNNENCKFKTLDSYVVYVVSKGYAVEKQFTPIEFNLSDELLKQDGVKVYFSSSKKVAQERYMSTGNSRLVAIVKASEDLMKTKQEVDNLLKQYIVDESLDYRTDIGVKI